MKKNMKKLYEEQQASRQVFLEELKEEIENTVVYVNELDYVVFTALMDKRYSQLKEGFELDWFRHMTVPVRLQKDGEIHAFRFTHFITHGIIWSLLKRIYKKLELESMITEDHIFNAEQINQYIIKGFIDDHVINVFRGELKNETMNKYIHDMLYTLSRIPRDFNDIMSITMSIETFIDVGERHPRVAEIYQTRIGEDKQPSEIEQLTDRLTREQLDIIANDDQYNDLKPLIRSGQGIKPDQFKEFAVNGGLKPDLDGNTIPIPVDTNLITDGLNSITSYYIDAKGGRKSLIMNSTAMGNSGYFARLLMLLCSDTKLSNEKDCGTLHTEKIPIKDQYFLDRLVGRYYRLPNETRLKVLRATDTHLIGQTIRLRSPASCASKPYICDTCYGELAHTNRNLNSVGGLAATEHSEPISQKILSSKHLLATISEFIEFNGELFDKYMNLSVNEVMINPELQGYDPLLLIKKSDIRKLEDVDAGGVSRYVYRFFVMDENDEKHEFSEKSEKELLISPDLEDIISELSSRRGRRRKKRKGTEGYIAIPFSEIDFFSRVFLIEIHNNELTKPLNDIKDLLDDTNNYRQREGIIRTEDMVVRMIELLEVSGISAMSVHSEIIVSALVRSASDEYMLSLPNLRTYSGINDVRIMTIRQALTHNPSVAVSLSYQELRKQLLRPSTYMKKGYSHLDPLFMKQLHITE